MTGCVRCEEYDILWHYREQWLTSAFVRLCGGGSAVNFVRRGLMA